MKIISSGRRTGKTTALVEHLKLGAQWPDGSWSRVLITSDEREAARLRHVYSLDERQVFSAQAWSTRRLHHRPDELLVDNLEDWLYNQFGSVPAMVSMAVPVEVGQWGLPQPHPIAPPPSGDYECCASGSCEVCRPHLHRTDG